ncbi:MULTISPECIES: DUF819 family protein [Jonquetella]|uniref:Putative integral membrane protein n=1 Tax=Jonquetella anthropi DSM 22815 TaxID=885272 RepID=H0UJD9_9BACT|nr:MULTISPECIES: DUF819 family protein [Jonquetella]EEX49122.1 hypothetical protein GCWU000246_00208 [Jonquetella anthropi E3_33 E1]EHM13906.1 putative integral membrane protein [Jonquetella anthropi DSM 22815]ERL24150.1 PF05684 family protein [Jonquetella sp. BV3C21]
MESTLIRPDDIWSLWALLVGWAAVSIYLEQKYRWAAKVSGAVIALLGALVLSNLRVIPTDSPVYDAVWEYVVLLAVPMMLFGADLRRIWRESGRTFLAFHLAAFGTGLGATLAIALMGRVMPEPLAIGSMMTGSYIGGTVNFVAMADQFHVSQNVMNAAIVADNLNMTLYFFVLFAIPTVAFFRRHFPTPYETKANELVDAAANRAAAYWGRKEISLLDIAKVVGTGFVLAAVSVKLASWVGGMASLPTVVRAIFGSKYFVVTTLTVIAVTCSPKYFAECRGSNEIGTFLIYIFLVVIGAPASIGAIIRQSPILLVFCAFVVCCNMLVTLALGKLFRFNLEELLVASNATVGGPTTAAAMAISKGWSDLVLPAMLVGVWGYVIGNWCAVFLGQLVFPSVL